jgi:hypothetical protein
VYVGSDGDCAADERGEDGDDRESEGISHGVWGTFISLVQNKQGQQNYPPM